MEYLYTALLLHSADQDITEDSVTEVLEAAGVDVEESRVKALVAALEDVDIDEVIEEGAVAPAAPAPSGGEAAPAEEAEEEEEEEEAEAEEEVDEEAEEEAAEGLGELFG